MNHIENEKNIEKFLDDFHNSFTSEAYKFLGSHYCEGKTIFRVYAPHAQSISVVGDFNNWNGEVSKMKKVDTRGIWEAVIDNTHIYENYKYQITAFGKTFLKQDPYCYHSETSGRTSSKIYNIDNFTWEDDDWLEKRKNTPVYDKPVNIYEVHIGSWKRNKNNQVLNYRNIADKLIPYVKKMNYNYIELMPLTEYPFDGSWGYQVNGYYSITSRYGTPDDFMYLVNMAHKENIGIIMDWVPAHFPKDDFGLYEFDGTYLYEDSEPIRMEYRGWGTRIFNYKKSEIKSFLISSARFLFEKYHIDGIRVDAVAAMIYLDYDRDKWIPNCFGGNYNLEAIDFLRELNIEMFKLFPNIMMIAEESTAFPKVTHPVYEDGLGFNYKWNMGWMNDTLQYAKTDPLFRKFEHNKLTFSMTYAFCENFILPLSHDEVVHGKHSLLDKMPGEYDEKFANLRAVLGYMMTIPGKKLLFMGSEFAQFIEWDYNKELDWFLLKYPKHKAMSEYVKKLNKFYLRHSELYEIENSWEGFTWINPDDKDNNCLTYIRRNKKGKEIIVIINFSGSDLVDYRIGAKRGKYKEVFNSDLEEFGGNGCTNKDIKTDKIAYNGFKDSLKMRIPKLSIVIIKKY